MFITIKTIRGKSRKEGQDTHSFIYHLHEYLAVGDAKRFVEALLPISKLHTEHMVEVLINNEYSELEGVYLNQKGVLTNIKFLPKT